ncbi:MAG: DUF721 domain-containing protein [Nitrospira sp.]|nr:DUF721 domain-containing protein [Nitrospira sp.]
MPTRGSLDSCSVILSGLAKRLGLESKLLEARVQRQWPEIMGEPIASQTWPAHIRFKKLYLTVRNSVWLQQLTYLKPTLLAKLHDSTGAALIEEIVLRVGEIPMPISASTSPSEDEIPADSELGVEMDPHTAGIQDPDLRKRFTTAILKYPSRQAPHFSARGPSQAHEKADGFRR